MSPEPPLLLVRPERAFWIERTAPEAWTATLQALDEGCYDARVYDTLGNEWPIVGATPLAPPATADRWLPWRRVAVQVAFGSPRPIDISVVRRALVEVLRVSDSFSEQLRVPRGAIGQRLAEAESFAQVLAVVETACGDDVDIDRGLPDAFVGELRRLAASYLAEDDPHRQSGFGGGADRWREEREPILTPVRADGTFLDIGCANGLLLECLVQWASERGIRLTPFGVDRSAGLVALARRRLDEPGRVFVGNAWTWSPPRRFDYVYAQVEVVPDALLGAFVLRLLERFVEPGGLVILGAYGSRSRGVAPLDLAGTLSTLGYGVDGSIAAGSGPVVRFAWLRHRTG